MKIAESISLESLVTRNASGIRLRVVVIIAMEPFPTFTGLVLIGRVLLAIDFTKTPKRCTSTAMATSLHRTTTTQFELAAFQSVALKKPTKSLNPSE